MNLLFTFSEIYDEIVKHNIWSKVVSGLILLILTWFFKFIWGIIKGQNISGAFKSAFNIWAGIKSILKKFIKYLIKDAYLELEEEKNSFDNGLSRIFTPGIWRLVWEIKSDKGNERGEELFEILEGNKYYKLDADKNSPKYTFDLYIRHYDKKNKNVCICKVRTGTGQLHSEEFLKMYPSERLEGVALDGSSLYYEKYKSINK